MRKAPAVERKKLGELEKAFQTFMESHHSLEGYYTKLVSDDML